MRNLILFIIAFTLPLLYWRGLYFIAVSVFNKPFTRTKTGLQVHHIHYGILFILVASITLLIGEKNSLVLILLGLGLGLMLDEFIPSLLMPGNRLLELEIYRKSLLKTILLFLFIIMIMVLLYLIKINF